MTLTRCGYPLTGSLLLLAAVAALFSGTAASIVTTWLSPGGAHGPVILALGVYMVWANREQLREYAPQPAMAAGAMVTAFACLLLLLGRLSGAVVIQSLSLIIALFGLVLLLGGYRYLPLLGLPIGYLVFAFPWFSDMFESQSIFLQKTSAAVAHVLIRLGGIPVSRVGQFLELPNLTLEVAPECNGVNHIMALVGLSIPLGFLTLSGWLRRFALAALAFVVGLLANGLRIAIIGYLAYFSKSTKLHGPHDVFYVSSVFFGGMFVVVLASRVLRRGEGPVRVAPSAGVCAPARPKTLRIALSAAVALLAGTAIASWLTQPLPAYPRMPLGRLPTSLGLWAGRDTSLDGYPFNLFKADLELRRTYTDGAGNAMQVYVGYFPMQMEKGKVLGYRFDPLRVGAKNVLLENVVARPLSIKHTDLQVGRAVTSAYYCYWVNGKILAERREVLAALLTGAILERRTSAAIIVVTNQSAPETRDRRAELAFVGDVVRDASRLL